MHWIQLSLVGSNDGDNEGAGLPVEGRVGVSVVSVNEEDERDGARLLFSLAGFVLGTKMRVVGITVLGKV